ncbi:PQQ-dependent sugar dehydrogenase [Serratia ureilytica]
MPQVYAEGQGGLLEVLPAPTPPPAAGCTSFANRARAAKPARRSGYGRLSDDGARLENFTAIFRQPPKLSVGNHFGGKLAFDRQGLPVYRAGRNNQRPTAQETDKLQGSWCG